MKVSFIIEMIIWTIVALSMVGVIAGLFTLSYGVPETCWRTGIIAFGLGVLVHAKRRGY